MLGAERPPFHGRNAPSRLLEAMSLDPIESEGPPAAQLPAGAKTVLFSDFYYDEETISERVSDLASAGVDGAIVQIIDPYEEEFPFSGRVRFADSANSDHLVIGDTTKIRSDYHDIFNAHRQAMHDLAAHIGWTFIAHRTDQPAHTALLALYTALSDQRAVLS